MKTLSIDIETYLISSHKTQDIWVLVFTERYFLRDINTTVSTCLSLSKLINNTLLRIDNCLIYIQI